MDVEAHTENRSDKLKRWLKDRTHFLLLITLLVAFAVRLYYLFYTNGQALWWDEAEYMATAKHWAFGVPYDVNIQRPPLFQLLATILLKIGVTSEFFLKLVLVVLPSVLLIGIIYLVGRELFNKKVGLIAAFASAFMWSFVFWSTRFQPDFLSVSFQLLAIFFFWKLFKTNKRSFAIYAGMFIALAFYFKISALLVPLSLFIFILVKDGISFVKNKNYWVAFLSFVISLIPFAFWQYVTFGNPFGFAPSYIGGTGIGQGWEFGWMAFDFFYAFPKSLFFILFLFGGAIILMRLGLSADIMFKQKEKRLDAGLFSFILLLIITIFYVFYIRGTIEDRWVFLMAPFIFYFAAEGLLFIYRYVGKYHKIAAAVVVLALLSFFLYSQIQHTHELITLKKDSYLPVKQASLWIKDNSNPGDLVLSNSYTQATAYAEREIIPYPALVKEENSSYSYIPSQIEMLEGIVEQRMPRYFMVSVFERHPDWTNQWLEENTPRLNPVWADFADAAQTQPTLIVYEIRYP